MCTQDLKRARKEAELALTKHQLSEAKMDAHLERCPLLADEMGGPVIGGDDDP